jgi:DNA-binding LytR/AlgR family response regulator
LKNNAHPFLKSVKEEFSALIVISVSLFLFILFFQPFPLEHLVYNDRLLYVAGFGGITFILTFVILNIIPLSIPKWFKDSEPESIPLFILNILLFTFIMTAFSFYIKFVGKTNLSLYILFKTLFISLIPTAIMLIMNRNKVRNELIKILQEQNKFYLSKLSEHEDAEEVQEIEIYSANKSDKIKLNYKELVLIKSADNYIEVFYLKENQVEKKLLRNTLKNAAEALEDRKCFIRCHRTSLVNILHIDNLSRSYNGYDLTISHLEMKVPVSRQYLMNVKEAISIKDNS